jgi:cytochrome c-type biogenesis protein CcmH/NrfF
MIFGFLWRKLDRCDWKEKEMKILLLVFAVAVCVAVTGFSGLDQAFAHAHRHGAREITEGFRCMSCGGTGFQRNSNVNCFSCNGTGRVGAY